VGDGHGGETMSPVTACIVIVVVVIATALVTHGITIQNMLERNYIIPKKDSLAEFAMKPGELADLYSEKKLHAAAHAIYMKDFYHQSHLYQLLRAAEEIATVREALKHPGESS
jgi:hypothetical protein